MPKDTLLQVLLVTFGVVRQKRPDSAYFFRVFEQGGLIVKTLP